MKKLTFTETNRSCGSIYCPYTITLNSEETELFNKKREKLKEETYSEGELVEKLLKYVMELYGDRVEELDQDLSEVHPGETEETTLDEEEV